jgi:HSP20 family protein
MANGALKKDDRTDLAQSDTTRGVHFTPRVDILETSDELLLYADLPGVKPEDADVRFENGELTIHGCCKPRQEETNYLFSEYGVGDFHRTFSMAEGINPDKISAELKHGVLTVHLPKAEAVKPKKIAIKSE